MVDVPGRIYFKDDEVYSDWFTRGADGLIVRAEIIDSKDTVMDVDISVYTKASEDAGKGSAITGWTLAIDGTDTKGTVLQMIKMSDATNGMSELVRYRIVGKNGSAGDWMRLRIYPPVFYESATS